MRAYAIAAILLCALVLGSMNVSAASRFNRTEPPDIFLDPNADVNLSPGVYSFSEGWDADGEPLDYNKVKWPQTETGSELANVDPDPHTDHQVAVGMELPTSEEMGDAWYVLELWVNVDNYGSPAALDYSHMMTFTFKSALAEVTAPAYYWNDPEEYVGEYCVPVEHGGHYWQGKINISPFSGLPWHHTDFEALDYWIFHLDYHYGDHVVGPTYLSLMYACLNETEAPTIPAAYDILRPDGDVDVSPDESWHPHPGTDLYACLDETTFASDNGSTIITTDLGGTVILSLSDPNADLSGHSYNLELWIICKSSELLSSARELEIGLIAAGGDDWVNGTITATTGYVNYSVDFPICGDTGIAWTFTELGGLMVRLNAGGLMASHNFSVSQIGIMLVSAYDLPTEEEESHTFWMIDWISGGGVMSLLGILGFLGMIATPAITYLQYRNGEDSLLAGANGIWLMVFFFGLFVTSLMVGG